MTDEQIERRAKERGEMQADIKNLIKTVDKGFEAVHEKFDKLDCTVNTKKIDEMYITHNDNKELRQHTFKSIIGQIVKSGVAISTGLAAGATVVYAFFK